MKFTIKGDIFSFCGDGPTIQVYICINKLKQYEHADTGYGNTEANKSNICSIKIQNTESTKDNFDEYTTVNMKIQGAEISRICFVNK